MHPRLQQARVEQGCMLAFLRERVWPGVSKVRVNAFRAVLYRDPFRVRVPAHLGEHDEEWANMVRSGGHRR